MNETSGAKLITSTICTSMSVADAVIRDCNDREWLEDVVFYIEAYIYRRKLPYSSRGQQDGENISKNDIG